MKYKHKITGHLAEQDNLKPEIYNISGMNTHTILPKEWIENSNDWEEIKSKILFTTHDGVDLYEPCDLYCCYKTGYKPYNKVIEDTSSIFEVRSDIQTNSIDCYFFSTKEACQAYLDNIHKPKQDYEILSFICNQDKGGLNKGNIITKQYNDTFTGKTNKNSQITRENVDRILLMDHWSIHSIKRLSDGEVFTIGDSVRAYITYGIITKFSLGLYNDTLFRIVMDHNNHYLLSNVNKVKFTPIERKYTVEARNNDELITVKLTKEKYDLLMELLEE